MFTIVPLPWEKSVVSVFLLRFHMCVAKSLALSYQRVQVAQLKVFGWKWTIVLVNTCKYIIGGIYRHPGHNINTFCRELESSFESVRRANIPCVIAGDFNNDLAKYDSNRDTYDYLNTVLLNNFMPMIIPPTRITKNSSTLIDHIYYYEGSNNSEDHDIVSGNFWSNLTDHLPNHFLITSNCLSKKSERPLVRIFSKQC